jgi:hypothetical protein
VTDELPSPTPNTAASADNSNPYAVITDKNVFRLNPPPPPPPKDNKPPPDLPQVKLSGFMETGDKLKVLLSVTLKTGDPKMPESTSYLTLAEGEKEGVGEEGKEVVEELVKVYADEEKIDLVNSGTPMTLSMKDNGYEAKPAPAAAPGGRGGTPAILNRTIPTAVPQPLPPVGGQPAMGAAPVGGENLGGGGTMIGGGGMNRGSFGGSSTVIGGGSGLSTGFQTTQTAFSGLSSRTSFGGGETMIGGGQQPAPAAQPTAIPLSPGLPPRQPNSTPIGGNDNNGIMPPVPTAPNALR